MRRFTFDRRYAVESLKAYLFLLPSLVVLSIFVFWPIGFSLVLSFFKWDFKHQKNPVFIGWENYAKLFRLEGMPFNFLDSLLLSLSFLALGLLILFSVRLYFERRKYWILAVSLMVFVSTRFYLNRMSIILLLLFLSSLSFFILFLVRRYPDNWRNMMNSTFSTLFFIVFVYMLLRWYAGGTHDVLGYLLVAKEKSDFIKAIYNTLYYVVLSTPTMIFLALGIALLLNKPLIFRAFFRTSYFVPFVTSVVAISLVWKWIFNDDFGLLNYFLSWFNIDKIAWLKDEKWTIPTIAIVSIWKTVGYDAMIFLAGLQNIDRFYYEAAEVDGANAWQKFVYITWPLLSPTTFFILIVSMIAAFKVFTEVYVLYEGLPGPYNNSGLTIVYFIFDTFYQQQRMGYACAAAYVLFSIILVLTLIQFGIGRKKVQYEG
ncbi:MAG: sugar ABC transporter permease [Thermotogae bacterium]|nr:sugar ABC transporter permease [Thermotogota bacterium]